MSAGALEFSAYGSAAELRPLEQEWRALHTVCSRPSVYNGFDFLVASLEAFHQPDVEPWVLVARRAGEVVAIFPFQLSTLRRGGVRLRLLEYAAQWEIDKPYPLIRSGLEPEAWQALARFLRRRRRLWHVLALCEVAEDSAALVWLPRLFRLPGCWTRVRPDTESPLVALDRPWEPRWLAHRKMRKKVARMQRAFGERMCFEVHGPERWEAALHSYLRLEGRSWKAGRIGMGKDAATRDFYHRLFARLARQDALRIGFLYVDGEPVAAEVAYLWGDRVYFSHGTYDERFAGHSPGMVSTCLFLRHFHGGGYRSGDYLGGFAGYLAPWADRTLASRELTVFRISPRLLAAFAAKQARRLLPLGRRDA